MLIGTGGRRLLVRGLVSPQPAAASANTTVIPSRTALPYRPPLVLNFAPRA
jgi:hypothetical protein